MDSFEALEMEINNTRNAFYGESGKNTFFKKQQKFDCAQKVASQIPMEHLLSRTCWIQDEIAFVRIDYTILKTYASPEVFEIIVDHIIQICKGSIATFKRLNVLLNLDTFTVSAAERYKVLIELFCQKCFQENLGFSLSLEQFIIYNSPSTIDLIKPILLPLLLEEIRPKIRLVSKKETPGVLCSLGCAI
jgi:hypothetical protein